MWTLIVVFAFYQRSVQPEIYMHDFGTKSECIVAENWTTAAMHEAIKTFRGGEAPFMATCVENKSD